MDDKFLSYSQASTNRDYSNFDGTIQNLYTSKFGELTPVFVKPVLADDSFKISLNSEVKVSTLQAPAYTNIKQNFYSFFVPIQSVWSHHNDFITNGTEFQNVYGSNLTNQDLKNPWKVPSVLTNQLQAITKVAKGFAIPIISLHFSDCLTMKTEFEKNIFQVVETGEMGDTLKVVVDRMLNQFWFSVPLSAGITTFKGNPSTISSCNDSILANLFYLQFPRWRQLMKICPYVHFRNLRLEYNSRSEFYNFTFDAIDFGLSIDDFPLFFEMMCNAPWYHQNTFSDTFDYQVSPSVQFVRFRYFCNEHSQSVDVNNAPFGIAPQSIDTFEIGNLVLNGSRFYRKSVNIKESVSYTQGLLHNNNNVEFNVSDAKFVQLSDFWYKEYVLGDVTGSQGADGEKVLVKVNDDIVLEFSGDLKDKYLALFESDDFYPELYPYSYCGGVDNSTLDTSESVNYPYVDSSIHNSFIVSNASGNFEGQVRNLPLCDILIPFYVNVAEQIATDYSDCFRGYIIWDNNSTFVRYYSFIPLIDSGAITNGMTSFTFMLYLANSAARSLDYTGIPIEGFTVRDFESYVGETINMLPFICQSKIWDEYFRNRTVSSPEFDYCQVNGLTLYFNTYYNRLNQHGFPNNSYIPDDWQYRNSWVIPFDVLPKSGVSQVDLRELFNDANINATVQGFNEFHYFNITCFGDLFALFTGFQLNHCVMHQVAKPYRLLLDDNETYITILFGALVNRFFLPNYYNGLLHFKYQNFNKDYFSSSLLDAMSGSNQEDIPDTVTELRSAEARQSFWEQTAVARSVKKFFNKMFGTTPSHMERDRPLLLGQSHNKISVGEIIQTSGSVDDGTPQGTRTGIAGGHDVSGICKQQFNEQGYLIILSSITIDSQYYQGLQRNFVPFESYLDYPFPQFYHIGNQSINMREISYNSNPLHANSRPLSLVGRQLRYTDGSVFVPQRFSTVANNPSRVTLSNGSFMHNPNCTVNTDAKFDAVFGFVPRFSEWKFNFDELHGDFRTTLMPWNTFRTFHTIPFLSHNFVNWELSGYNYDLNRLFAVTDDSDKFICSLYVNVEMHRPIPYYTVPKTSVN